MNHRASPVISDWLNLAAKNRGTDRFHVSLAAFRSILEGHAPGLAEIAASTDLSLDYLHRLIPEMVREGRLTLDDSGEHVTGAGGLSLVETRHRLEMNGRRFWVWCALDAVGIPAGLALDAEIFSITADTGETVRIEMEMGVIESVRPSGMVVALTQPDVHHSLRDCCCPMINYYRHPANVPANAAAVSLEETSDLGRQLWREGIPL